MLPRSIRILFVVAVTVLAAALPSAASASDTKDVEGPFTSELQPPPACTSPIGICTLGHLMGDLDATYYFVMDTLVPAGVVSDPNLFYYTGHSVITLTHGGAQMLSNDTGYMDFEGTTNPFVTTVHIYTGTHQYKDASGTLVAAGEINFVTGAAAGSYFGSIDK